MKTALVTSFDREYLKYSYVFVKTLSENYSGSESITLYCLVPEDTLELESDFKNTLGDLGKISIKFVCHPGYTHMDNNSKLHGTGYISNNAWHRIFIPSIFRNFDRVIYIDSDTMVSRDIDPILSYEPHTAFAAFIENNPDLSMALFRSQDIPYFNAGVFIADLNYWRNSGIEKNMIDLILDGKTTKFLDQDMLNKFFKNDISPLPITFNYPAWYDENHEVYIKSPIIVHFVGNMKPWKSHKSSSILPKRWRQKHLEITGIDLELTPEYMQGMANHD